MPSITGVGACSSASRARAGDSGGRVKAEARLDSSLYAELVVLGFGSHCVILGNPELAKAVIRRCREGLAAHEDSP